MITEKFPTPEMLNIKVGCQIFPNISDRSFWEKAKESSLEYFLKQYEELDKEPRGHLTASLYREFKTNGNRSRYEKIYFARRYELIIKTYLECFYNDGRFMDDILDLTWMILEETTWCLPAHNWNGSLPDVNDYIIDLFAAETACTMAFVYSTVRDKLNEMSRCVTERIRARIEHDIFDNFLERNDYGWLLFHGERPGNWTVWVNSNILASAMMICDDWEKLRSIVHKVIRSIDKFIDFYPTDGASEEGASYWNLSGLSMLENFWLLSMVTDGQVDFLTTEKSVNTLDFFMKCYTGNGQCINFADCTPDVYPYYATMYKMAKLMGNKTAENFAKKLYRDVCNMGHMRTARLDSKSIRLFDRVCYLNEIKEPADESFAMEEDYYFDSIQVMTSKSGADATKGLFLTAKGGHNGECHNHNDIGQFMVYKNGTKFIVDSGNMTYSAITFSKERYTLYTTRSAYHNVPLISGMEQKDGEAYTARDVKFESLDGKMVFSLDIKDAYENRSEIGKWVRTFEFDKKNQKISVTEDFGFAKEMEYELHFLTPQSAEINEKGIVFTAENGEVLNMDFDVSKFEFSVETMELDDKLQKNAWGDRLYRIALKAKAKQDKLSYLIY